MDRGWLNFEPLTSPGSLDLPALKWSARYLSRRVGDLSERSRPEIRKWGLWLIFISMGFVLFELDWVNNHIDIQLLRAVTLAGYISKKGFEYSPWFVGFSIPIGAIVFLTIYSRPLLAKIKKK